MLGAESLGVPGASVFGSMKRLLSVAFLSFTGIFYGYFVDGYFLSSAIDGYIQQDTVKASLRVIVE